MVLFDTLQRQLPRGRWRLTLLYIHIYYETHQGRLMSIIETATGAPALLSSEINRCSTVIVFGRPAYVSLCSIPQLIEEYCIDDDEVANEIAKALTHVVMNRTGGNYIVRPAHPALVHNPDAKTLYFVRCPVGSGETDMVTERHAAMMLFGLTFTPDGFNYGVPWAA